MMHTGTLKAIQRQPKLHIVLKKLSLFNKIKKTTFDVLPINILSRLRKNKLNESFTNFALQFNFFSSSSNL